MPDEHEPTARLVTRLVGLTREGCYDKVAEVLTVLVHVAPEHRLPESVAGELTTRCALALLAAFGKPAEGQVFTVVVADEAGERVPIDTVPPGVRAVLRAVVAEVNGDLFDRRVQLELATSGTVHDVAGVLAQCVSWAADLLEADTVPGLSLFAA